MSEYLTTSEVAELLRIKERKVYDLASSGELPCNKAIGKLLFPRDQIDAWLAAHAEHVMEPLAECPPVFLGSHDPLLEWSLRESQSGLAMLFDGSNDGLQRFKAREGVAAGLHILDEKTQSWNVNAIEQHCAHCSVVLIEWAVRQRGLIVCSKLKGKVASLDDLASFKELGNLKIVPRQPQAGAQVLFSQLLAKSQINLDDLTFTDAARTETDVAVEISSGAADVGFGLASVASSYNLHFVPLVEERFDLLVDRQHYFEEPLQRLWAFCQSERFAQYLKSTAGYDASNLGSVRYNSSAQAR